MANKTLRSTTSRRDFLRSATALGIASSVSRITRAAAAERGKRFAFVGTYTGAIGSGSNGEGIYRFEMNAGTGELSRRALAAKTPSPSWIVIHPSKKYLYAANEVANYQGGHGSVSAFLIDKVTGELSQLNTVSSEGAGPAHMSIDGSGKFVFAANYGDGSIAVLPILEGGALGAAVDSRRDSGSVGSEQAEHAAPGSFAISGHDAPHAHMIVADLQNKFVLATDLGQDRIYVYRFDSASGKLTSPAGAPFFALPSGDGPRHIAFHPNGKFGYVLTEMATTVTAFSYDAKKGALTAIQTAPTLPKDYSGPTEAAEIVMHPSGKFLYASNRAGVDTITIFAIDPAKGTLKEIGRVSTKGRTPRNFAIDPTGAYLLAANQESGNVVVFKIDAATGALTPTGEEVKVPAPVSVLFLEDK